MRSGVATAVNRQKPKMAENGGPIRPLPACLPLSQSNYTRGPIRVMHTQTQRRTYTPLTLPFPQTSPLLMRSLAERSCPSDREGDGDWKSSIAKDKKWEETKKPSFEMPMTFYTKHLIQNQLKVHTLDFYMSEIPRNLNGKSFKCLVSTKQKLTNTCCFLLYSNTS